MEQKTGINTLILFMTTTMAFINCESADSKEDEEEKEENIEPKSEVQDSISVTDFEMKSQAIVTAKGDEISTPDFEPEDWYEVTVPTTVLRGLVANGIYPDPYVGLNNMEIPDAHDGFNETYDLAKYSHLPDEENPWAKPYWFRSELDLPNTYKGKEIILVFEGINYRADVWLNGHQVADSDTMVGMYEVFHLPVTETALPGDKNVLAVAIHPLDYPGEPAPPQLEPLGSFGENGGQTGDIGKNVTMQASAGWDWIPAVRDRNMGIWQKVFFHAVAPIDIRHSRVITDLPLPDTDEADLTIETELVNPTDQSVTGTLKATILSPDDKELISISKEIEIDADTVTEASFKPKDFKELTLLEPELWWPTLFGDQPLYTLTLDFTVDDGASDTDSIRFGVREVSSDVNDSKDRRQFYVNGKPIQLRGGAWVPDMLLDRDAERYEKELRFSKEANFNMVRVWGGGVTPPDSFFDICDELGLLVWHDFWITGDCNGTWSKGTRDWPLEEDVFLSNARSVVKRLRHHASLLVWTGGNEGYAREEIYKPLRDEIVAGLDGTRPFLPTSGQTTPPADWGLSWPDDDPSGVYTGGPYWWVSPEDYFVYAEENEDWLHKDEIGVGAVPPYRSLEQFITDAEENEDEPFALTTQCAYHDAMDAGWAAEDQVEGHMFSNYDEAIRARYGEMYDLKTYSERAQMLTAENTRAIYEAANSQLDRVAGILLWKTNSAWPSLIWQVYDWYLRPNAGFYYAKRAGEPLHIQLNLDSRTVEVVNRTFEDVSDLTVVSTLYSIEEDGSVTLVEEKEEETEAKSMSVGELMSISLPEAERPYFAQLTMLDADKNLVSENIYWLSDADDFTQISQLDETALKITDTDTETNDDTFEVTVEIANESEIPAIFVNPLILDGKDGPEVLPTYWSDNYFILLPGEKKEVTAEGNTADFEDSLYLKLEGINVTPEQIEL